MPSSLTSIGLDSFEGCVELTINGDIKKIPKNSFKNCKSLKKIVISSPTETIGKSAFEGCAEEIEISIPSSIKTIKKNAFLGIKTLTVTGNRNAEGRNQNV